MNFVLDLVLKLSKWAQVLAGTALVAILGLTVLDVGLRSVGKPIVGSYEIVGMMGPSWLRFPFRLHPGCGGTFMSILWYKNFRTRRERDSIF